jgi:hypothetical protein
MNADHTTTTLALELCPGCAARLPHSAGPTHRYIGASAACWALFAALLSAGEPPLAPGPLNGLLGDAYAAQHPGTPSDQATQSVAVHLLTLYGVLVRGVQPTHALWIRQRALRTEAHARRSLFQWLTPPSFVGHLTVADVVQAPTPAARTAQLTHYVQAVWSVWAQTHVEIIVDWYDRFVVPD